MTFKIASIALLFFASFASFAQSGSPERMGAGMAERPSPEQKAKFDTKKMTKKLELDKNQATAFYEITLEYALQQEELIKKMPQGQFPPSQETRKMMKDGMTNINVNKDKEMKALLSESQFQIYADIRKKEMEEFRGRRARE